MLASTTPGESPPPAPRACFGRDELVEKVIELAEDLTPIALIGAGGIGKTSIALTVLHHHRIKQRFGANRRFIRCDEFPASCAHLLGRLSKVIGMGVENSESLAFLRPFLSSREMFIVLDNAESILDPQGTDAEAIYAVVEELSQLDNICLCITSRISAVPSDCETLDVPTLSIGAARDAFYRIYKNAGRSDLVDNVLSQLDFHPLSVNLLATVAHQNKWDMDRMTREWDRQRTRVLQTMHNKSLAATIELSLGSLMFQELGPDARALLEVVAFFPQGVDQNSLDWLFPTISDGANIFDKFCVLSLTYRTNSFITMLAPLRDHLRPGDPTSSRLLCMAKERYFARMSVSTDPDNPGFGESRWIVSEDVNVEHLLDVFTTVDANSDIVWDACADFIRHLVHHKQRLTILKPKIEDLPDDHRSKPDCLFELSQLFALVGNHLEYMELVVRALTLYRRPMDNRGAAHLFRHIFLTISRMDFGERGVRQFLETFERTGYTLGQAHCLITLASSLHSNEQFDAAEAAASRAIALLSGTGEKYRVCKSHRLLGNIYCSKGEAEKAIHHFEVALQTASSFGWYNQSFLVHYDLAGLLHDRGRFESAQAYLERAKSYAVNNTYFLGHAMRLQAVLWCEQRKLEEARSEALCAIDAFERLGAAKDLEKCRVLLRRIEGKMNGPGIPEVLRPDAGELLV